METRAYADLSNNTCSSTVSTFTILDSVHHFLSFFRLTVRFCLCGRPPPRSSTADPVLLQWEWKDGEKAPPSSLDLSSVLFCPRRTDGQRPSLFFLLNSAPSPTDRQEKGGGETDRPKQQPVSLFRRSRAPATLARILSFSSASAAPPCPPTYGAVCRQQAIKEASAGGSGSARAPVSNA